MSEKPRRRASGRGSRARPAQPGPPGARRGLTRTAAQRQEAARKSTGSTRSVPRPRGAPPSPGALEARRVAAGRARPKQPAAPPPPKARPQREPDEGFVAVGRVLAPFGLHGEIKVQSLTDNPRRWKPGSRLWFGRRQATVKSSREAQGYVFLKLEGFPDRTSVEPLRHAIIQVPESELPTLPAGEHYRFQLVGLRVEDRQGHPLGVVEEVLETGANDVLRVRTPDGRELLLAALPDVIVSVDLKAGRIVVDPPEWM